MLSAGKLQNRCPGCRSRIWGFYNALLPRARPTPQPFIQRPRAHPPSTPASARAWPIASSVRHFSSTPAPRQEPTKPTTGSTDPTSAAGPQSPEEIEAFVRQARQTFGQTLPRGYLTPEEYKVYERLYGPPLRETAPEDVGIPFNRPGLENFEDGKNYSQGQPTLFRENEYGHLEEVEYTFDRATAMGQEPLVEGQMAEEQAVEDLDEYLDGPEAALEPVDAGPIDYLQATANNPREYEALLKLQADFEAAARQSREQFHEEEEIEQEEPEEEEIEEDEREPDAIFSEDGEGNKRLHEYTRMGLWGTKPSTLQLPKVTFVEPISTLLARTDITHIRETAERVLGGPGLPYGPATPKSKSNLPQKPILLQAGFHRMSQIEADAYLATVMPGLYATITSILVEVRKRLGEKWIRDLLTRPGGRGPRVLDVGAGGAGLAAWQHILQAQWDVLREKGEVRGDEPPSKRTVVVGNDNLRHRISQFLHNTTFLPRLPDYLHSLEGAERELDSGGQPQQRKQFDIIIAAHSLMPLDKEYKRRDFIDNLWTMLSPEGGVLIVIEKGHPRGFEAVAEVRDRMLNEFIIPPHQNSEDAIQSEAERQREPGMIVAPCTNHSKCPMYLTPGLSRGRKDFCHFSQRFIRPPFLQKVLGASHRSHEDIDFSYLVIRRGAHPAPSPNYLHGKEATDRAFKGYEKQPAGSEPPNPLSLPRNILTPLKRKGHITLDLCTPAGTIERWIVPKSFSKQAYHDARKAEWGDLWALGAKTRTLRNVRLGKPGEEDGKKKKPKVVNVKVHPKFGVLDPEDQGVVRPNHQE
jgi:ribosomal protein RSM22 (predicted rRNA methylase)